MKRKGAPVLAPKTQHQSPMASQASSSSEPCIPKSERKLNFAVKLLLLGALDKGSGLHVLIGVPHIIQKIWLAVKKEWRRCVLDMSDQPDYSCGYFDSGQMPIRGVFEGGAFYRFRGSDIAFPKFTGININMMPFIMTRKFEDTRLPKEYEQYFEKMIQACIISQQEASEEGKIGFLTIHESEVGVNQSQRRPGIHTEKSRRVYLTEDNYCIPQESLGGEDAKLIIKFIKWGRGRGIMKGGIFMTTNVVDSCKIWNCKILDHPDGDEVIGPLGDISHLETLLPAGKNLEANRLYWMTDRTPHQSLLLRNGARRQFFRLVTSEVSVWYQDHSTPNPTGLLPDPNVTTIIRGSKFAKKWVQ